LFEWARVQSHVRSNNEHPIIATPTNTSKCLLVAGAHAAGCSSRRKLSVAPSPPHPQHQLTAHRPKPTEMPSNHDMYAP